MITDKTDMLKTSNEKCGFKQNLAKNIRRKLGRILVWYDDSGVFKNV